MGFAAWTGLLAGLEARADDLVWTNTAGGAWSTAANWSPNRLPASSDTAWITNRGTYAVTVSANATVNGLTLGGDTGTQTFTISGNTFTLNGPGIGNPHATLNLTGGTLAGPGLLALAGPLNWTGGDLSGVVQCNGGTISGSNQKNLAGGRLLNTGVLTLTATPWTYYGSILSNLAGATLELAGDVGTTFPGWGARGTVYNVGLVRKSAGSGTSTLADTFNSTGTLLVESGTLSLVADSANSGSNRVSGATAVLSLSGGTHSFATNAWLTGDGTVVCSGGTVNLRGMCALAGSFWLNGATVNFNSPTPAIMGMLTLSSGTLNGSSLVMPSNPLNWTGGDLSGVVQCNGGTISGGNQKNLAGGRLLNIGVLTLTATPWTYYGSILSNLAGATLELAGDVGTSFPGWGARGTVYNAGLVRKSAGSGTSTLAETFHSTGTVQVETGVLALSNGGDSTGLFAASANATLNLSGGTHNLAASSTVSGAGRFTVSGGTANLSGAFTLASAGPFTGGTANFSGAGYQITGALVVAGGTVNFQGSGLINVPAVTLSAGALGGANPVLDSGPLNWTGGDLSGVVQCNGGTISGGNQKNLAGGRLLNTGVLSLTATPWTYNGSTLSNLAGATLELAGDVGTSFPGWGARGTLYNAGLVRKSAGSGTSTLADTFNSTGTLLVESGTLSLVADSANSGSNRVSGATAVLSLSGGTHSFATNAWLTGDGTVVCSGGTVNLRGTCALAGTFWLNGATVNFNAPTPAIMGMLTISSGTLNGSNLVMPSNPLNWTGGVIAGLVQCPGGTLSGGSQKELAGGRLINTGVLTLTATPYTHSGSVLSNLAGASLLLAGNIGTSFPGWGTRGTIYNAGLLRKSAGSGTSTVADTFYNSGVIEAGSGVLSLAQGYTQTGGQTRLLGGSLQLGAGLNLNGGSLAGTNTLAGNVANNGGTVSPGTSPGVLTITGTYSQGSNGSLEIELAGIAPGTGFDKLVVGGAASLAGTLRVAFVSNFFPNLSATFGFLSCGSRSGTFSRFYYPSNDAGLEVSYQNNGAALQIVTLRPPPMLSNIVAAPSLTQCVLTFQTDQAARTQIEYGLTTNYGVLTALSSSYVTAQSVTLTGLTPGTVYHYRVHVLDTLGQEAISGDLAFVTVPDTTPPETVLASLPATVCSLPLALSWSGSDDTTVSAALQFAWRLDGAPWSPFATGTSLTCTQLAEGAHVFQVKARDVAGNEDLTPASRTFTLDTIAPVLSNVGASPGQGHCDLHWQANEPVTAQVEYGLTAAYGQITPQISLLTSTPTVRVTGLLAETNYHYRVISQDGCGHQSVSADAPFTTPPAPDLQVVAVEAPAEAWSDASFDVSWMVTNTGLATATGPWVDRVYLSADELLQTNVDRLLGEFAFTGSLASGQGRERVQTVTLARAGLSNGLYHLLVWTDARNDVFEGVAETNNLAVSSNLTAHLTPLPDLVVSSLDAPTNGRGGQTITVSWVVCNEGPGDTDLPLWYDHLYLSTTPTPAGAVHDYGAYPNPAYLGTGECYEQTAQVDLPAGVQGPFYLVVQTDATGQLREQNETNNQAATLNPIQIQYLPPGFLHVASVQVAPAPPTTVWAGEPVTVTFTVRNTGQDLIPSSLWDHAIAFCPTPHLDCNPLLAQHWHLAPYSGSLAPGQSYSNQVTLLVPAGLSNGTYNVVLIVDPLLRAGSPGPYINRDLGSATLEVRQPPPADLELLTVTSPTNAVLGQAIPIQWTVANNGNNQTVASYWYDAVYLSPSVAFQVPQSRLLGTFGHWGSLDLGAAYNQNVTVTVPSDLLAPGTTAATNYLFVLADAGQNVVELSKSNNLLAAAGALVIGRTPPADLAVQAVSASGTLVAGRPATLTWTVQNRGQGATDVSTWWDRLYLSADMTLDPTRDFLVGTFAHNGTLAAGAAYTQNQVVNLPVCAAGLFYLLAVADSGQQVSEAGALANNLLAAGKVLRVLPNPAARLQVADLVAPTNVQAGAPLAVAWRVSNAGNATTNAWVDAVYLSPQPQFDLAGATLLGTAAHQGGLAGSDHYDQTLNNAVPRCLSGAYFVYVVADANNAVNGAVCETNNWRRSDAPVMITPGTYPSLQVASLTVPPVAEAGVAWTLQWTVTNAGLGTATGAWSDAVYGSPSPVLDTNAFLLARFDQAAGLAAGASYQQSQAIIWPACQPGQFYLFVVTDVDYRLNARDCAERNRARSEAAVTVHYGAYPDLQGHALDTPATIVAGPPFTLTWTITNAGAAAAIAPWVDSLYLTPGETFEPSRSLFLGARVHLDSLAAQATTTESLTVALPANLSGSYRWVVVTDSSNSVQECVQENNNLAVSAATLSVQPTAYVDLQVAQVQAPSSAWSGQSLAVSWIVTNAGTVATLAPIWYDALYLSKDQVLDPATDLKLGTYPRPRGLGVGERYTNAASIPIPSSASGPYYLFALADSGGQVFEYNGEDNNLVPNPAPLLVTLSAPADLTVTNLTLTPASGLPGDRISVAWTVRNQSSNSVLGTWTDALYLSTNRTWDWSATAVARQDHSGLPAAGAYTATWSGPLPALTPGAYYALVRSDVRNTVRELDQSNNVAASANPIVVDVPLLTLGQAVTNSLRTGTALYYKINLPAGETVRLSLRNASGTSATELSVRFGAVPDLGHYDLLSSGLMEPNQEIIIPTTQAGWYYLLARADEVPGGPAASTLLAEIVPFEISSVSTDHLGDNGQVTLTLRGARFQPGSMVKLASPEVAYTASEVTFVDGSTVKARFRFTNAVRGVYDLAIINPGGASTTAPHPLTIEEALPLGASLVNGLVNMEPRAGLPFQWNGSVQNAGNTDIPYLTVSVLVDAALSLTLNPPPEAVALGTNATDTSGFLVRDVPPRLPLPFSFQVTGFGDQSFQLTVGPAAWSREEFLAQAAEWAEALRQDLIVWTNASALPADTLAALSDTQTWGNWFAQSLAAAGLLDPNDVAEWPSAPAPWLATAFRTTRATKEAGSDQAACYANCMAKYNMDQANNRSDLLNLLAGCALSGLSGPTAPTVCTITAMAKYTLSFSKTLFALKACILACNPKKPSPPCATWTIQFPSDLNWGAEGSGGNWAGKMHLPGDPLTTAEPCPKKPKDPNEKVGPSAYGAAAFAGVQQDWRYAVYFENVSNAAATARQVLVTDPIDPSLDLRTFRLREIAFGGVTIQVPTNRSFFQTRVPLPPPHASNLVADVSAGVDLQTGQVFWTLNAIDLQTGELVASADEGLLPPNDPSHAGEGHVIYTIRPKAGVPTGTLVTNQAVIVFDTNEPIETNPTTNTVDGLPPTSTVAALPAVVTDTNVTVTWWGEDDPGGAGLASCDLYVSDSGAPWRLWLSGATEQSAVFAGQAGHQYYFFSRARDNTGNLEAAPAIWDAATFISNNRPPALSPISDHVTPVGGWLVLTNQATDPDGPASGLSFALEDAPFGASIRSASGVLTWQPLPWQGGTTNVFTVTVTDHGLPPRSTSESFVVVVGDHAEWSLEPAVTLAGQAGCLSLRLMSSTGLTNCSFTLVLASNRLHDLSLTPTAAALAHAHLTLLDATRLLVTVDTLNGLSLRGTQEVARLCFTTPADLPSGVVSPQFQALAGLTEEGTALSDWTAHAGRVIVIADQPLLEVAGIASNLVEFRIYGQPNVGYELQTAPRLGASWSTATSFTLTNATGLLHWTNQFEDTRFFRLRKQ